MFAPPQPMMREYCERDAEGTGPVLDQDEGEEVSPIVVLYSTDRPYSTVVSTSSPRTKTVDL